MWRVVMRPELPRPPDLFLPSVSILTGPPFHRCDRSTSTRWRRPADVGRYVFSAMGLQSRRYVDAVPVFEGHDGLLDVAEQRPLAAERLQLALAHERVDRLHLDVEEALDGLLDLRL